jgi:6-phosphogluconolactonase (cycloisomerase 2 family)
MIRMAPGNRFVLYTDLGQDRIYVDRFDARTGKLTADADTPYTSLPSGDGPRHFVFHSNGHWLYSLQEESSTVAFFMFDTATGTLHLRQTISTLPPGFGGTSFASEILASPDGRFLYTANRLHNTIAAFSIGQGGRLTYLGETPTLGDYPRQLNIDPSGTFFYVCNQRSDNITSFRKDPQTGLLIFTGQYTPVGSPTCITFIP